MGNLNVTIIGEPDYGKEIGKKGTVSDLTFYDLKKGFDTVTIVEPSKFPEKLSSLFFSLTFCDFVIFVINDITAQIGEAMVAADVMGIKEGIFVLKKYHTPEEIMPLIKGTKLENYEFWEDDPIKIREMLIEKASTRKTEETDTGSVPVDHFFNVKGVGTVVLGTVISGTIRKHDKLKAFPTDKIAQVRSIQKHDDNFDVATQGDRVGLALKNITAEELDRGYVLSTEELLTADKIKLELSVNRFWKKDLEVGMVIHIGHWMQFLPAKIENIDNKENKILLEASLDRPLAIKQNNSIFITQLDTPKLRIIGSGKLI